MTGSLRGVLAALLALSLSCTAPAAERPAALQTLIDQRSEIATRLAAQIAFCVARRDTAHAAFNGCIDWHSSVHGVWALMAYQRATGSLEYAKLFEEKLDPTLLEDEMELLRRRPGFERPYGRVWFLRLALEHELLTGTRQLRAHADAVLADLLTFYETQGFAVQRGSYESASWALVNMIDYADQIGDYGARSRLTALVRRHVDFDTITCSYASERRNFMAICTNIALLAARSLPDNAFRDWAKAFVDRTGLPDPVIAPANWHEHGLNFSRAWGLWELYERTGDPDFADAYVRHVRATLDQESHWRGVYHGVGHWVAQFGFFALQPLFGPENGR